MKNNELNSSFYFNDIIKLEDFDRDNILIYGKSLENILIYNISYETLIDSKPLWIRFRIYDRIRYVTLFGSKEYEAIYDRIGYLISQKVTTSLRFF